VIDKLEIRVPAMTPVGKDLEPVYGELRRGIVVPGFRPSPHYSRVGDLRPFGINAIAHLSCKRGARPNHKLELLDTGQVGFDEILGTVEQVFRFDPLSAEVMRVDLAADVDGVSVSYFERAAYAAYKRWACDIGKLECSRMGSAEIETIYLGKRPNCIRIYNKVAEYRQQYRRLERDLKPRACPLPFERIFHIPETAILTRVERQIAAGRVPPELSTVQRLRENAADFNPFDRLRLIPGLDKPPKPNELGLSTWLQGMQLRRLADELGMQRLRKFVNRHSKGNAARMFAQFAEFLPSASGEALSEEGLYGRYRESIARQLAA
jgi:hypothetical protein